MARHHTPGHSQRVSEESTSVKVTQSFGSIGLLLIDNDNFDDTGCELADLSSNAGNGAWRPESSAAGRKSQAVVY